MKPVRAVSALTSLLRLPRIQPLGIHPRFSEKGAPMRVLKAALFIAGGLAVLPASAFAQTTLSGVVRDSSGAVLPGVPVEAASPALIDRVRSGVTDGAGQQQGVDWRPGRQTVTFT